MHDSIPETMRAMVLTGHGGLDRYAWHDDWPVPRPEGREVLLKVLACGLNNTDVNTRTGWYAKSVREPTRGEGHDRPVEDGTWSQSGPGFPRIQGADVCGRVVATGPEADRGLIGRRVIVDPWLRDPDHPLDRDRARFLGSEVDGGFAEYVKVDERNVFAIDSPLSDAELATFPCSWSTAEGMLERAGVGPEDTVLVTGASGGVGSALLQLARRRGARVVGLAAPEKHAALAPWADALLPRSPGDLAGALKEAIGRDRVTVVADIVGGPAFPQLLECLVRGGRYVTSGAIAGPIVELDLRTLYLNDLTLLGSTVIAPGIFASLVDYIGRGEVQPMLAASYPLERLREAQAAFIEKRHAGNIVVIP